MADAETNWAKLRIPVFLAMLIAGLAGIDGVPDATAQTIHPDSTEIVAAVPRNFPPVYDSDAEGRPIGYGIDLMNAVAERAELKVRYVIFENWRTVGEALINGTADIIPSSGISPEREALWSYTIPTERFAVSYFVLSESPVREEADLAGKRVGLARSSAARSILQNTGNIELVDFGSFAEVLLALLRGNVDGMVYPTPIAQRLAADAGVADHLRRIDKPILTIERGIAVRSDMVHLLPAFNDAIQDLAKTGEIQAIHNRWFGWSLPYWTVERVAEAAAIVLCLVAAGLVLWRLHSIRESRRELKESENLVRLLLESVTVGYGIEDLSGKTIHPNEGIAKRLGYTLQEMQAMHFTEFTDPEFAEADQRKFQELAAGRIDRYEMEKRYVSKNGKEFWGRVTRILLRDKNGRPVRCFGVLVDITDRKLAENALAAREAQLTTLIDGAPAGIFFKDRDSRYLIVNQTYCDFHGFDRDSVIGRTPIDFQKPDHARRTLAEDRQVLEGGGLLRSEETLVSRDGVARRFSLSKFPVTDAEGNLLGLGGMLIEITELKNAERYAIDLGERMNRILNSAGEGICELDMDGAVTFINSTGAAILGWSPEELTGRRLHEIVHAKRPGGDIYHSEDCPVCQAIHTATEYRTDDELFWKKSGEGISVSLLASPIYVAGEQTGIVLVFEDITERLSIERQLRQAQKMEAVGQLTGGVAHDFNNLLQVIAANLELAKDRLSRDDSIQSLLESAGHAVQQGGNLTQKLLAFSRKQALRPEVFAPYKLIEGMLSMLARTLGEDIEIEPRCKGHKGTIKVDAHSFENALLNLALNARAAMPRGGKLIITSTVKRFDDGIRVDEGILPPGAYAEVAFTDTGCGMSREVMNQAFEPFFTTKDVGEGSGLGLSMVYGFARQSGGDVTIESEVGKGTTVRILLPAKLEASEETREMERTAPIDQHGIKVLLVEDDADVRSTTVLLLKTLGCEVEEAENATPVLDLLRENADIGLLLSDVVLPGGTNGIELAQEAIRLRPDLRVILVSGYPEAALEKAGLNDAGFMMLAKPYSRAMLSDALDSMMAAAE